MSSKEALEHLVHLGVLSGVSESIGGCLYQDNTTDEYYFYCCDNVSSGRICKKCRIFAPNLSEMFTMELRRRHYNRIYEKENCLTEMKRNFKEYVQERCSNGFLLYMTLLDFLREWDVTYVKFSVMDFRENFIRDVRKSIYVAAFMMGWPNDFEAYVDEGFCLLSEEDRHVICMDTKAASCGEPCNLNVLIMKCI